MTFDEWKAFDSWSCSSSSSLVTFNGSEIANLFFVIFFNSFPLSSLRFSDSDWRATLVSLLSTRKSRRELNRNRENPEKLSFLLLNFPHSSHFPADEMNLCECPTRLCLGGKKSTMMEKTRENENLFTLHRAGKVWIFHSSWGRKARKILPSSELCWTSKKKSSFRSRTALWRVVGKHLSRGFVRSFFCVQWKVKI